MDVLRVYFDNVEWENDRRGPHCFANRLARALVSHGIHVADPDDYDVALVFVETTDKLDPTRPYVHRVDGLRTSSTDDPFTNERIRKTYDGAVDVVWQSEFGRRLVVRSFGERDGVVIGNGVPIRNTIVRSETFLEMRRKYDRIFVCSANWTSAKRLTDHVKLFQRLRETSHPNSCLIVMGRDPSPIVADRSIFYTGSIRHDLCDEAFAVADWMLHLAYHDCAPNTVVEALGQGCPVVCSSEGGASEVVALAGGLVIPETTTAYGTSFPPFPLTAVTLPEVRPIVDRTIVDIERVAAKYAEVLRRAVSSSANLRNF